MRTMGLISGYQFGKRGICVPLWKQALIVDFLRMEKKTPSGRMASL